MLSSVDGFLLFFSAYHPFLCLWFENGLNAFSISHFNIFFFTRFSSEVYYSRGLTFNSFFETSNFVSYRLLRALRAQQKSRSSYKNAVDNQN